MSAWHSEMHVGELLGAEYGKDAAAESDSDLDSFCIVLVFVHGRGY